MFARRHPSERRPRLGEPVGAVDERAQSGGAVVVAGATSGGDPPAQLNRVFYRQISVIGSTMGTRAELERLIALVRASGLRPLIDRTYPLAEARAALGRMAAGEHQGKIVLVP